MKKPWTCLILTFKPWFCIRFRAHLKYEVFLTKNKLLIFSSYFLLPDDKAVVFFLLSPCFEIYFKRQSLRIEITMADAYFSNFISSLIQVC